MKFNGIAYKLLLLAIISIAYEQSYQSLFCNAVKIHLKNVEIGDQQATDAEFHEIILSGGMLLTAEVSDNSGTHGEVIAMLIRADGEIVSLVMSCRVFDRKLEFVFLLSVLKYSTLNFRFHFQKTDRNDPFCRFYFAISDCLQNGILNRELYRNKFERFERLMECNHSFKNYGE